MTSTNRYPRLVASVCAAAALTLTMATGAAAQQAGAHDHGAAAPSAAPADRTAEDARLQELMKAMDSATGNAKVDRMAAVISELVAQRQTSRAQLDQLASQAAKTPASGHMDEMMKKMKDKTDKEPMKCGCMSDGHKGATDAPAAPH